MWQQYEIRINTLDGKLYRIAVGLFVPELKNLMKAMQNLCRDNIFAFVNVRNSKHDAYLTLPEFWEVYREIFVQ